MASPEKINIPQKPPMVMVDKLIFAEEKKVVTSFLIRRDNIFCSDGVFTEAGLIENMAQTAAAGDTLTVVTARSRTTIWV